jgi:hypothetical protein
MGEITKLRHDVIKRYKSAAAEQMVIPIREPHVFCWGLELQFDSREIVELRIHIDREMATTNYGVQLNAAQRNGQYFPVQWHVRDRLNGAFTLVLESKHPNPAIVDLSICATGVIDKLPAQNISSG